jgi:YD repeat-containing protein
MTQPLNTITDYGYDTQDNLSSITDLNENTTQYWFDDFGRKDQTASPDTGITDYLYYDGAGNLTQRVDAKETVVNYTYDALNRLTAIQFPSDPNQNVTFTYDSTSVT